MKHFNQVRKFGAGLALSLVAVSAALATPAGDYDAITEAVDWTSAGTALGVIAAALALVLVIRKGLKLVLGMIK